MTDTEGLMESTDRSAVMATKKPGVELALWPDQALAKPDWLDYVEARLVTLGGKLANIELGEVEGFPITHRFTPGLLTREIFMPARSIVVSKTHKTEHPYVISQGSCWVFIEEVGWQHLQAPHTGITKPGTRRLIFIETNTVWTAFYVTQSTDCREIESLVIEENDNPLLAAAIAQRDLLLMKGDI